MSRGFYMASRPRKIPDRNSAGGKLVQGCSSASGRRLPRAAAASEILAVGCSTFAVSPTLTILRPMAQLPDLVAALERYWGYTSFRPLQEKIVLSLLEG